MEEIFIKGPSRILSNSSYSNSPEDISEIIEGRFGGFDPIGEWKDVASSPFYCKISERIFTPCIKTTSLSFIDKHFDGPKKISVLTKNDIAIRGFVFNAELCRPIPKVKIAENTTLSIQFAILSEISIMTAIKNF